MLKISGINKDFAKPRFTKLFTIHRRVIKVYIKIVITFVSTPIIIIFRRIMGE